MNQKLIGLLMIVNGWKQIFRRNHSNSIFLLNPHWILTRWKQIGSTVIETFLRCECSHSSAFSISILMYILFYCVSSIWKFIHEYSPMLSEVDEFSSNVLKVQQTSATTMKFNSWMDSSSRKSFEWTSATTALNSIRLNSETQTFRFQY